MKQFNEVELKTILSIYRVGTPRPELVSETTRLMREEMVHIAQASPSKSRAVYLLLGMAILLSLNLFYMVTVGTILSFALPPAVMEYFRHALYAFICAGVSLMSCSLMVVYFKYIYRPLALAHKPV